MTRHLLPLLVLPLLLGACEVERDGPAHQATPDDLDGDGYTADVDCDDSDPERSPGKAERCNGIDDDCDTLVDDADPSLLDPETFYTDADGDGFGDAELPVTGCSLPGGAAEQPGDCDDSDAGVSPEAAEDCRADEDLDCDEFFGCNDPDCFEVCREDCDNGIDDDQDGYTDCEDRDCLDECTSDDTGG